MKAIVFRTGSYLSDEQALVSTQSICVEIEGRGRVHFVRSSWPADNPTEHHLDNFEPCNGDCHRQETDLSVDEFKQVVTGALVVALNEQEKREHEEGVEKFRKLMEDGKNNPPRPRYLLMNKVPPGWRA